MTPTIRLLRPLALLLPLVLVAPLAVAEIGAEKLANGGFELDADNDGMPDGWTLATPLSTCLVSLTSDARTGAKALEVSASGGDTCRIVSDAIPISAGDQLDAQVYGKHTSGSVGCYFSIVAYTARDKPLDDTIVGTAACHEAWTRSWQTGPAPLATAYVQVQISIQPFPATVVHLDDASLKVV